MTTEWKMQLVRDCIGKGDVYIKAKWLSRPELIPVS